MTTWSYTKILASGAVKLKIQLLEALGAFLGIGRDCEWLEVGSILPQLERRRMEHINQWIYVERQSDALVIGSLSAKADHNARLESKTVLKVCGPVGKKGKQIISLGGAPRQVLGKLQVNSTSCAHRKSGGRIQTDAIRSQ
jgi:hypothetical protein